MYICSWKYEMTYYERKPLPLKIIHYQLWQCLGERSSSWCRWPEPLEPRQRAGSWMEPGSMVLALSTHQPPTQLALSRSHPLASVFIRKPFFLSHRDRNLASRHGQCQGSCLGPSFRLSACQKEGKTKYCGWEEGVKEPARLQITGYTGIWVSRTRNIGISRRGWKRTEELTAPTQMVLSPEFHILCLGFETGSGSYILVTVVEADSNGGGKPQTTSWECFMPHSSPPQGLCACFPLPGDLAAWVLSENWEYHIQYSDHSSDATGAGRPILTHPQSLSSSSSYLFPSLHLPKSANGRFPYLSTCLLSIVPTGVKAPWG